MNRTNYKIETRKSAAIKMLKYLVLSAFLMLQALHNLAQTDKSMYQPEFRAAWITTIFNTDWPSAAGLSAAQQQQELRQLLDLFQKLGFNAVLLQIRPSGDALYASKYEPWSRYLSGQQGLPPQPYYDPLEFAIAECHKRNMELHAWFNPFRAMIRNKWEQKLYPVPLLTAYREHPEWFVQHGERVYFNPGVPGARAYLINVIMDVVNRYDIDGVHFDDYFYPYPVAHLPDFNDSKTYNTYALGNISKSDWRRENINIFIRDLSEQIYLGNPNVKFGIGPPGVWRNNGYDIRGSATRGLSAYDDLYADVRKWLEMGWIDYVAPQLYSAIGNSHADFSILSKWWNENAFGRHVYVGHAYYRQEAQSAYAAWRDPNQLIKQMNDLRQYPNIKGSIFYSSKSFKTNPFNINHKIFSFYNGTQVPTPEMPWKKNKEQLADITKIAISDSATVAENTENNNIIKAAKLSSPKNLHWMRSGSEIFIFWNDAQNGVEELADKNVYYKLYKFRRNELIYPDKAHLFAVSYKPELVFERKRGLFKKRYTIVITQAYKNAESETSEPIYIRMNQ